MRPAPTWALVAAIAGSSMSFIDGSAVNVALPVLQRELGASAAAAQWVMEGYALFLAALILIGGSLADVFGRRLVFGCGVALFAAASIACGFAPNADVLIAARCVQGVGGALATPGSLALISASYPGDAERGRAIGTWSAFSAVTSALGPVIGGWLVQSGSWRAVFFINVPVAAVVLAILAWRVAESHDPSSARAVDAGGASLATAGLGSLVYGLIRLQGGVPDAVGVGAVAAGLLGLALFIAFERRAAHPMIRPALFASRTFSVANSYTFLLYAALGGSFYFIPFDLIDVQGYPPAAAGAALLPFVAILFVLSRFAGGFVARTGPRTLLVSGALLAAAGFAVFAGAGVGRSYWVTFFPGVLLLGLGGAAFVAPLTTTVMEAVDDTHAGIASGINNAISRAAGLVAIAALGIVLARGFEATFARELGGGGLAPASTRALAAGRAQIVSGQVPPGVAAGDRRRVSLAIRTAFADGFRTAMYGSAGLALLAALVAAAGFAAGPAPRPFEAEPASR